MRATAQHAYICEAGAKRSSAASQHRSSTAARAHQYIFCETAALRLREAAAHRERHSTDRSRRMRVPQHGEAAAAAARARAASIHATRGASAPRRSPNENEDGVRRKSFAVTRVFTDGQSLRSDRLLTVISKVYIKDLFDVIVSQNATAYSCIFCEDQRCYLQPRRKSVLL